MGHSVLVVDDQPVIRDMLQKALARYKYSVHCAGSAQEALGILASEKVDVVISDEVMPGMSGTEFLTQVKDKFPEMVVITDVCLCQYTDHGHCGVVEGDTIDNDASLDLIARTALSHAKAGADMVAPSDMMDGRVGEIREILDENNFSRIPIMSYAAKYCSAYYGPFRSAADSAPKFGDRRTYQMDPANALEAIREVTMDIEEGADIIMVKPALAYLDIICRVREEIDLPVAAYNVSGEFSMIKAAEKMGWIDGSKVMMETLTAIKRAGADMILTYFAIEAAQALRNS